MISSVFFSSAYGKVLLFRAYNGDSSPYDASVFSINILKQGLMPVNPIIRFGFATYFVIKISDLYFVACCYENVNAALVLKCMSSIKQNISHFLNCKINAKLIKDRCSLFYDILDVAIDGGFPQDAYMSCMTNSFTGTWIMGLSIDRHEPNKYLHDYGVERVERVDAQSGVSQTSHTGVGSSKDTGLYTEGIPRLTDSFVRGIEELDLFVSECIHCTFSSDGEVMVKEVYGSLVFHCKLSMTPTIDIELNTLLTDKQVDTYSPSDNIVASELEKPVGAKAEVSILDYKVDGTVDSKYLMDTNRIRVTPPNGYSVVMIYRSHMTEKAPVVIKPKIKRTSKNSMHYLITVDTCYKKHIRALSLQLYIPIPSNTIKVDVKSRVGICRPMLPARLVNWMITKAAGESTFTLDMECKLNPSARQENCKLEPIIATFTFNRYSFSGLHVRQVSIKEDGLFAHTRVFYTAKSGTFTHRLSPIKS